MADRVLETIIGIVGPLIPIIWVVEIVLSATWHKNYFTIGVPIFAFRIPVEIHHTNIPSCSLLESNFKSSGFIRNTSLLFKEIEPNMMGFRERLLQWGRWYSVMHGLLIFDTKNSQVIVKGFLDWTISYFSILWIIGAPLFWLLGFERDEPIWLALLVYSILFINLGIFCSLDYIRFSRVAKFAAQAWSRHYATIVDGV
jgi:hypothetical protein